MTAGMMIRPQFGYRILEPNPFQGPVINFRKFFFREDSEDAGAALRSKRS